jgi:hypothetical protein
MKKVIVSAFFFLIISSSSAYAKKPGGWTSGNAGHQLGCLIISILGMSGCEKPRIALPDAK